MLEQKVALDTLSEIRPFSQLFDKPNHSKDAMMDENDISPREQLLSDFISKIDI
jgi:hypothetical protein